MNKPITDEQRELAIKAQAPLDWNPNDAPPEPVPNSTLALIERALHDPSVDVAKLEKLMELAERVKQREAKEAYYAAMADMQTKLPVIQERGSISIGKGDPQKYALWEDINKAIKPILQAHGFALSFRTGIADKMITVTGVLSHRQGHAEETTIHLPSDTSGSKNAVQAVGSSTSYGKRYTASALLNLTSTGEDDDGKAAGQDGLIDASQVQWLRDNIAKTNSDIELFCQHFGIGALTEMTKRQYPNAVEMLNLKERKKAAKK